MFHNTYQAGFLSILYSIGSKPLQIWDSAVQNGHIKRITDEDIQSSVLEIVGSNVSTTFIQCPAEKSKTLGIKLPYLMIILKNVRSCETERLLVIVPAFPAQKLEKTDAFFHRASSCRPHFTRKVTSAPNS
jgi:hypothetical protein